MPVVVVVLLKTYFFTLSLPFSVPFQPPSPFHPASLSPTRNCSLRLHEALTLCASKERLLLLLSLRHQRRQPSVYLSSRRCCRCCGAGAGLSFTREKRGNERDVGGRSLFNPPFVFFLSLSPSLIRMSRPPFVPLIPWIRFPSSFFDL